MSKQFQLKLPRSFFPSIPSPRNHIQNSQYFSIQTDRKYSLSPISLQYQNIQDTQIMKEEKVVSNFLVKYLYRKQIHDMKWKTLQNQGLISNKSQKKINPQFRRVYLKKIKESPKKKSLHTRFLIGNISSEQLFREQN